MINWPQLPENGFISGKAADDMDVKTGHAVFSMDGKSSGPIDIVIPQYALWTDENEVERPVIVVQAERAPTGMEIVGLLMSDGTYTVGTMPELQLLGTEEPQ